MDFRFKFLIILLLIGLLSCNRGGNVITSPPDPPDPPDLPVNHPPIAAAHVDANEIIVGDSLKFYDGSTDPDGDDDIVNWEWDFSYNPNDGFQVESEEREPVYVFEEEGDLEVQLRVTDLDGLSDLLDEPLVVSIRDSNNFNLQEVFRIDDEINPVDVEVQGHLAYVLSPEFGLEILDISDPNSPVSAGKLVVLHHPKWIEVEGNYVYLLNQHDSILQIINIANPLSPELVAMLQLDGNSQNMVVRDGYLYITRGWEGILIIDVSNPYNAIIAGAINLGACAAGIDVYGDHAVILDKYESAFYILDISTPGSAHVVRTVNTLANFDLVKLSNGYAYVAASQSDRLVLYDIDPPELAYPITEAPHAGMNIMDIDVVGNSIYIHHENSSLFALSSDPTTPFSYISHVDSITGFAISADVDRLCVIDELFIRVLEVDPVGSIFSRGKFQDSGFADDIAISGNKLLLVSDGLSIYDISDPYFPYYVSKTGIQGISIRVETDGQYAYVLSRDSRIESGNYFSIININTQEIVLNRTGTGYQEGYGDITIQNGYAYICNVKFYHTYHGDLQIWDVDPPSSSTKVAVRSGLDHPSDVAVKDGYAYVTYGRKYYGYGMVGVYDVDPPDTLRLVKRYITQSLARALAISGEYVFVVTQDSSESRLEAYKISGPGELEFIDAVTVEGYAERIVIDRHHAYIANFQGVQIFDISDPENMTSLVSYFTDGNCINLEVDGNYLYLVDSEYGVRIIKLR